MSLVIYSEGYDFSPVSRAFEGEIKSDIPVAAEIAVVDGEYIRGLNSRFRGIDAVTDVLSFPALQLKPGEKIKKAGRAADVDENGNLFLGSIAICLERAESQAEEYGHSKLREIFYLAVHGVCHLLGYDHIAEEDKALMRAEEEKALAKINLTRDV